MSLSEVVFRRLLDGVIGAGAIAGALLSAGGQASADPPPRPPNRGRRCSGRRRDGAVNLPVHAPDVNWFYTGLQERIRSVPRCRTTSAQSAARSGAGRHPSAADRYQGALPIDTSTRAGRGMIGIRPRSWMTAGLAVAAVASSCVVQPAGVAGADVCGSVGRRIHVSGCA